MTNVQRYMMKLAEEKSFLERAKKRTKKFFGGLGTKGIKRKELGQIKKEIKETKAQTEKEKAVERLAGRKYTPGQYARRAAIGAGIGAGAQTIGTLIEGKRALRLGGLKPRALTRSAAVGAMYGAALPAVVRLADIESAKRGKF